MLLVAVSLRCSVSGCHSTVAIVAMSDQERNTFIQVRKHRQASSLQQLRPSSTALLKRKVVAYLAAVAVGAAEDAVQAADALELVFAVAVTIAFGVFALEPSAAHKRVCVQQLH